MVPYGASTNSDSFSLRNKKDQINKTRSQNRATWLATGKDRTRKPLCVYIYIYMYIYIYTSYMYIYIYTQCSLNRFCVCLVRTSVYRLILLVFGYTNKKPHIFYCEGYPSTTMILEKNPQKNKSAPKCITAKAVILFSPLIHLPMTDPYAIFGLPHLPSTKGPVVCFRIILLPYGSVMGYIIILFKKIYIISIYHPWKPHTDPSWVITTRNRSHDRGTLAGGISSRGSGRLRRHNGNRYALAKETEWPSYNA